MKHWPAYLQRQRSEYLKPPLPVECIADMIVVIPCFNEKKPTVTLNSLIECNSPGVNTQVVIVINSTVQSNKKAIQQNRETYQEVLKFSKTFSTHRLHFVPIIVENLPKNTAEWDWLVKSAWIWRSIIFIKPTTRKEYLFRWMPIVRFRRIIFGIFTKLFKTKSALYHSQFPPPHRGQQRDHRKGHPRIRRISTVFRKIAKIYGFPYYYHHWVGFCRYSRCLRMCRRNGATTGRRRFLLSAQNIPNGKSSRIG